MAFGSSPLPRSDTLPPFFVGSENRSWKSQIDQYFPEGVFPASAGMNRKPARGQYAASGVPRKRGDEPLEMTLANRFDPCSPQARG